MSRYNHPFKSFHAATTARYTVNTTVATLTNLTTSYAGAVNAIVQADAAPVRYAYGGYTPKAATGHRLDRYEIITLEGYDVLKHFAYVRAGATSTGLWVTFLYPDDRHPRV